MSEAIARLVLGSSALMLVACVVDGRIGRYVEETTGGDQATHDSDDGTSPAPTSSGGPESSEGGPGTGGETDGAACPTGEMGPCATCLAEFCCETLAACDEATPCACMYECLTGGSSAVECVAQCGSGAVTIQFSVCTMKNCAPSCSQG
jgi:hypothetical protein